MVEKPFFYKEIPLFQETFVLKQEFIIFSFRIGRFNINTNSADIFTSEYNVPLMKKIWIRI